MGPRGTAATGLRRHPPLGSATFAFPALLPGMFKRP